jgi:hypothetical protein
VELSDGRDTCPFDVVGAGQTLPWHGVECKSGIAVEAHRVTELQWATVQARRLGDPLAVVLASAAERASLEILLRTYVGGSPSFTVIARDNFFSLVSAA